MSACPKCSGTLEWQINTDESVCRDCHSHFTSVELMAAVAVKPVDTKSVMDVAGDLGE